MTATQAPTPGPLSVGDRVVAIADLRKHPDGPVWVQKGEEVGIVREYGIDNCIAGVALQDGREGDWAKSCFRLAPTAPVEASGSELKADFVRSHPSGMDDSTYEKIEDALDRADAPVTGPDGKFLTLAQRVDTLRPQPSGETREAVARLVDPKAWELFDRGWFPDLAPSRKTTNEILALLSARPLALGGQHSTATDFPPDDVLACDGGQHSGGEVKCECRGTGVVGWGTFGVRRCSCGSKISRPGKPDEWPAESEVGRAVYERIEKLMDAKPGTREGDELAFLAFLVESVEEVGGYDGLPDTIPVPTTPARAEAQDEGAAGEPVDLWYPVKSAIARAMQDERDGKPCGCIIEAGCEANGYHDASYAADGFLDAATDAVTRLIESHPSPTPAADADRVREEETEVQYEIWGAGPQGDFCAGADTLSDAQHYAAIYGQYDPVVIKVATTSRVVWSEASLALKSTAAKEGGE